MTAEGIMHIAKQRGVELTGINTATAGFLLGLAATMVKAEQLTESDRAVHAHSTFELMKALVNEDAAGFVGGWNLGVDIDTVVMSAHAAAGGLSEQGLAALKLNAAALSRDATEAA